MGCNGRYRDTFQVSNEAVRLNWKGDGGRRAGFDSYLWLVL